jgi:hypothetical protein
MVISYFPTDMVTGHWMANTWDKRHRLKGVLFRGNGVRVHAMPRAFICAQGSDATVL